MKRDERWMYIISFPIGIQMCREKKLPFLDMERIRFDSGISSVL